MESGEGSGFLDHHACSPAQRGDVDSPVKHVLTVEQEVREGQRLRADSAEPDAAPGVPAPGMAPTPDRGAPKEQARQYPGWGLDDHGTGKDRNCL